jgi:hypothetical protein
MEFNSNSSCIIEKTNRNNKMSKLLNINSRFRKNYYKTQSSNFIVDLPNTLKNVINIGLDSIELPNTFYSFSSKLKTDEFTMEIFEWNGTKKTNITKHKVRIKNGNYSGKELQDYLNRHIFNKNENDTLAHSLKEKQDIKFSFKRKNATYLENIECFFDVTTQKFIFSLKKGMEKKFGFNIDWRIADDLNRNIQLNMGWMLGFRQQYYSFEKDYFKDTFLEIGYVSESLYNPISSNYVFLSLNDYNNNYTPNLLSPFQVSSFNDNNILTKLIFKNKNNYDDFKGPGHKREYMGPVNISRLEVKILDEFGRIVDLNNIDFSFTISLEILYD